MHSAACRCSRQETVVCVSVENLWAVITVSNLSGRFSKLFPSFPTFTNLFYSAFGLIGWLKKIEPPDDNKNSRISPEQPVIKPVAAP